MLHYQNLQQVQNALRAGETSCVQLVQEYINRCNQNAHLNAFLEVFETDALAKAGETDAKLKSKQTLGKLFGLVIAVKDVFCIKNKKVTASSHILENFTSLYNATVIERLLQEDAIIIGRTNCDEFAMGSSNENSYFGPVKNFLDETKVPGGSSGGSAVAVQAGMCMAALGTDTGGSIRQPASFTGTFGFKPTYGRVSRYGMIAYASSFDQCGTFTTNAFDAAAILEVVAGQDAYDSTTSEVAVPGYPAKLECTRKLKIAYYPQALQNEKVDSEIRNNISALIKKLQDDGHTVEPVDFNFLDYLVPTYYVLTTAEASSNLSRFSGINYGYRTEEAGTLEEVLRKSRSEGFGKEVKRRIMLGTFVLSAGYYDAYYTHAQKVRRKIKDETDNILKTYDCILLPTTPTTAFGLNEIVDPIEMYLADIFTVQANITGLPAVSVPLFRHSNGLPFGVQIMGKRFAEDTLLSVTDMLMHDY